MRGTGGSAIDHARVEIRPAAQPASTPVVAFTSSAGRYALQVPGGHEYALSVEKDGYLATTQLIVVPATGTVSRDFRLESLEATAAVLDALTVIAPPRIPQAVRSGAGPGAELSSLSADIASLYPGEPGDLASGAGISGRYLPAAGGLSVGGQAPSGNRTTLDGSGIDAGSLPPDAVAAAGVFAHPYDVSRGQFLGGEIAGRTMSGTNLWGGTVRATLQDPRLSIGAYNSAASTGRALGVSGGGGGPLLRGRLFIYAAGHLSLRNSAQPPLRAGDGSLQALGIAQDSVTRFLGILDGLGLTRGDAVGRRSASSAAAVARIDYLPGTRHTLTLRLDGRDRLARGVFNSPTDVAAGGSSHGGSGGIQLRASSRIGRGVMHEGTVYLSGGEERTTTDTRGPAARVRVQSDLDGDGGAIANLSYAAQPLALADEDRRALEVTERVTLPLRAHRIQLGASYLGERITQQVPVDRLGTFSFASLGDFEAGRAAEFTRWLGSLEGSLRAVTHSLYAGDVWRVRRDLSLTYGARAERTRYPLRPDPTDLSLSRFGIGARPPNSPWVVSPRAGFTWARNDIHAPAQWMVRGGAGRFRAGAPVRALAAALAQPGLGSGSRLQCLGEAVPEPRWDDYLRDPAAIPSQCAGESAADPAPGAGRTGFDPSLDLPNTWQASAEGSWFRNSSQTEVTVALSASRGRSGALAFDANLVPLARFQLDSEEGRGVYVAPGAIDAASGRAALQDSRRFAGSGAVRSVSSAGRFSTRQLSLGLGQLTGWGLFQAYYTWTRSRDDAGALLLVGAAAPTVGISAATSSTAPADFEQRHALQLSFRRTLSRTVSLSAIGRITSGTPFTPVVDGDVNGDGFLNDRAFVFPSASLDDSAAAATMRSLLRDAPGGARSCLERQLGRIAGRNSCRAPWNSFLDLQLNVRPGGIRDGRFVFTVTAQNTTAALDRLLHGEARLRGWGQISAPDPVLLQVRGFDPDSRRFLYQVNGGFGSDRVSRTPFALRIQARIILGADPATQALVASVSDAASAMTPSQIRGAILRDWINVPAMVLAYAPSRHLALSPEQLRRLGLASDSVRAGIEVTAAAIAELGTEDTADTASAGDGDGSPNQLLARAQAVLSGGFAAAREILSAEQWRRLPRQLREEPRAMVPVEISGVQIAPDL